MCCRSSGLKPRPNRAGRSADQRASNGSPPAFLLSFGDPAANLPIIGRHARIGKAGRCLTRRTRQLHDAATDAGLAWHRWRGRGPLHPSAPRADAMADLRRHPQSRWRVALIAASSNLTIAIVTAYVGTFGLAVVAGYGSAARLEFSLVPLSFGMGGPTVILIGTNAAAGQHARARKAAWIGACPGFLSAAFFGLFAAIGPRWWLDALLNEPQSIGNGATYPRHAGLFFEFFGLGCTPSIALCKAPGA